VTATSWFNGDPSDEPAASAGVQPDHLADFRIYNQTYTAARSDADVATARLLVEIPKVMFLPSTSPTRIAVLAEKRRLVALIEAHQTRPS
jgi:hypothetical protein